MQSKFQGGIKGVSRKFQGVSGKFLGHFEEVSKVFNGVLSVFQRYYKEVQSFFQRTFKDVSRGCFESVSRKFCLFRLASCKIAARVFQECFKGFNKEFSKVFLFSFMVVLRVLSMLQRYFHGISERLRGFFLGSLWMF